jgi:hypothetical protein
MVNELPADFLVFAKQLGFTSPEQWGVSRGKLPDGWKRIQRYIISGRCIRGLIRDFVARMNSSDDHYRRKTGETGTTRVTPVSAQIQLFESLYPQFAPKARPLMKPPAECQVKKPKVRKPKVKKPVFVRIGFGLESTFRSRKIDRDCVILDAHTTPIDKASKSIIYVPGWSLAGMQGDGD